MCIWSIYLGKFDTIFWGIRIVQGRESFQHFVNSYEIGAALHYVSRS